MGGNVSPAPASAAGCNYDLVLTHLRPCTLPVIALSSSMVCGAASMGRRLEYNFDV